MTAWQADANARALAVACQRAEDKLICFLTASNLPSGNVDVAYTSAIVAFGGTTTPVFSIVAGALPTGLSLNPSTGDITGTPLEFGTFNFTVQLTTP